MLSLAEIDDEVVLEGSHLFLSGSALVFHPNVTHEAEQISSSGAQVAPVNGSDLDAVSHLADLFADGDEWVDVASNVPGDVSSIQASVPVLQNAGVYDVTVLQHQKVGLDLDIPVVDTAHVIIT